MTKHYSKRDCLCASFGATHVFMEKTSRTDLDPSGEKILSATP